MTAGRGLPAAALLVCVVAGGCDPEPAGSGAAEQTVSEAPDSQDTEPPPPEPAAPAPFRPHPSGARDGHAEREILPASLEDGEWAGSDPVEARRLVYRVHLWVPPALGESPETIPSPAAELFVDVCDDRLRARFVGPGWPVDAGSEVRLRADSPGVYVFDARGGRPLTPGELAEWFQGGPAGRSPIHVRVRRPPPQENPGTGQLVCALLAEWSGQERETVMRRCGHGPPAVFRLGPWKAERTADVPVDLPRSALRADQADPPPAIPESDSRAFVEPALLARIEPRRVRHAADEEPAQDAPAEGILVHNDSRTRIVVTAHGVPIGWVDPGADGRFVGLRAGRHVIAAMRPLGHLAYRPKGIRVPATVRVR